LARGVGKAFSGQKDVSPPGFKKISRRSIVSSATLKGDAGKSRYIRSNGALPLIKKTKTN